MKTHRSFYENASGPRFGQVDKASQSVPQALLAGPQSSPKMRGRKRNRDDNLFFRVNRVAPTTPKASRHQGTNLARENKKGGEHDQSLKPFKQ